MVGRRSVARREAESRVGKLLDGKWRLDQLLGRGGSAAVYAATHRNGKRAAIKILHKHCASEPTVVARFIREGYLANTIQHPGVVSILDDNVAEDGSVYLVMELLEGVALDKRSRETPLPATEVLKIADQVLDVLTSAHARGLVHRDIKPANLFLLTDGRLKLLDFGIARLGESFVDASSTQQGTWMGTPSFMAPEQARARWTEVDARSDLFAVGATMIALLVGRRPRASENAQEELLLAMTKPLPSLSAFFPNASPSMVALVDRAVAFERDKRWPDAASMRAALRTVQPIDQELGWLSSTMRISVGSFDDITIVTPPPANEMMATATEISGPPEPPARAPLEETAVSVAGSMTDLPTVPPPDLTENAMMRSNAPPPMRRSRVASVFAMAVIGILLGGGIVAFRYQQALVRPSQPTTGARLVPAPDPLPPWAITADAGAPAPPASVPASAPAPVPVPVPAPVDSPRHRPRTPIATSAAASASSAPAPVDTSHASDTRY